MVVRYAAHTFDISTCLANSLYRPSLSYIDISTIGMTWPSTTDRLEQLPAELLARPPKPPCPALPGPAYSIHRDTLHQSHGWQLTRCPSPHPPHRDPIHPMSTNTQNPINPNNSPATPILNQQVTQPFCHCLTTSLKPR